MFNLNENNRIVMAQNSTDMLKLQTSTVHNWKYATAKVLYPLYES